MFKWLLVKKNKRPKNILYLSIDAQSIGIAFLTGDKIIFNDRKFYLNNEYFKPIEVLFKETLLKFKNKHNFLLDEICVILEYPWVNEQHIHLKEKRLNKFVVTKNFINSFINKEFSRSQNPNSSFIIEKFLLDGHIYKNPIGVSTNEIQIYLTKFIEDADFALFIKNSIQNIWNKTKITFTFGGSFIMNYSLESQKTNDIYIVLGSADTSIKFYGANTLNTSVVVPFGFCNILEDLGNKWETSYYSTISWINLFLDNELNSNETQRIKNDIHNAFKPFLLNLEKIEIFDPSIPRADRPVKIFGIHNVWSKLFLYLLDEYINKKHLNIKNTDIINGYGDRLIDFYIKEDMN